MGKTQQHTGAAGTHTIRAIDVQSRHGTADKAIMQVGFVKRRHFTPRHPSPERVDSVYATDSGGGRLLIFARRIHPVSESQHVSTFQTRRHCCIGTALSARGACAECAEFRKWPLTLF